MPITAKYENMLLGPLPARSGCTTLQQPARKSTGHTHGLYVNSRHAAHMVFFSSGTTENSYCNSCKSVEKNRHIFLQAWTPLALNLSTRHLTE